MSCRCKMCTDLMGLTRDEVYFQKRILSIRFQWSILCFDWLCIRFRLLYYRNPIRPVIFLQIAVQMDLLIYLSFYQTMVILAECPVVKTKA